MWTIGGVYISVYTHSKLLLHVPEHKDHHISHTSAGNTLLMIFQ